MASVITSGQRRIGQQQPAPRRDAVGLVAEALGKHLGQILDRRRAQQLGMDRRHAVGAVRADDRQVGHAHVLVRAFLDQADALDAAFVAREAGANVVEQPAIDFKNDLEVPRHHHLEPFHRPLLQRFGQQRVVRVAQRSARQVPGLIPSQLRVVEQNPHQLRHRDRRMRIVELDCGLVGQRVPIGVAAPEASDDIGQRACDEKVLLHESQSLSPAGRIVGIQHSRQSLGGQLLCERAHEIALAEFLKVKVIRRGGSPQAK